MKREVVATIKIVVSGGYANPAPPVGPTLGQYNVNIMQFCTEFNRQTQDRYGKKLPVVITVYKDKSFSFVIKTPTVSSLLKEAAKAFRGSGEPNKKIVGKITFNQLVEIAKTKMPDLNARTLEAGMSMIRGTARSMGIEIVDAKSFTD